MSIIKNDNHQCVLSCDNCSNTSPEFETWEEAVQWGQDEDWEYNDTEQINLCRECQGM